MKVNLGLVVWLVEGNRSTEMLVNRGLNFVQIAGLIIEARDAGLLILEEDKLVPTEEGRRVARKALQSAAKDAWINPLQFGLAKRRVGDVYLPAVKKSFFES